MESKKETLAMWEETKKSQPKKEETKAPKKLGPKFMSIKTGSHMIRVLPPVKSSGKVFEKVYLHFGYDNPNQPGKKGVYQCMGPKGCPMCEDAKGDNYKKAKQQFLYYVLDEKNELSILSASYTLASAINDAAKDLYTSMNYQVVDENEGYWLKIDVVKTDDKTKYVVGLQNHTPHSLSEETKKAMANLKPLKEVYRKFSGEQLEKVINGEKFELNAQTSGKLEHTDDDDIELKDLIG